MKDVGGSQTALVGFHTATWDIEGAFLDQDPDVIDRIFTSRVPPIVFGCLQNTGSSVTSLETEHYVWRVSKVQPRPQYDMLNSGGTAFLFHKRDIAVFEDLKFFKITDDILGCEFRFGGHMLRVISVYIASDRTADPEFSALITYLLENRAHAGTTILMGNFNAEIGKYDQLAVTDGGHEQLGPQLLHDQSNHNGVLLKGLLEATGFVLSSSFSESQTTLETWATHDRAAQLDHILQSNSRRVRLEDYKAGFNNRIRSHHKCMFAKLILTNAPPREIPISPRTNAPDVPAPSTLPNFKAVTLNVHGSTKSPPELANIDRVLDAHRVVLACLQCTDLNVNFIETDHYFWKMANARTRPQYGMSMSGGTAILLHKSRKQDFEDVEFLDVTENILAYKCAFFGRPLQIISAYIPDDETAQTEFAELISYLVKTGDRAVTNIIMGDFHAEIGKHDPMNSVVQDVKIGPMVGHNESNANGILLKGLLELTKFELHSSFGSSDSVLSTCINVAKPREMQWDHVIVSHYDDFLVDQSQADWLDDIPTNHKALFTEFTAKAKAVVPIFEPVTVEVVPEDDPKRLKFVSWDIAGSLDFHCAADIDAALTFYDSSEDRCTLAASIACLQNTGLKEEVLETKNYKWRNLPNSGTAILFRKTLLDQVRPVNFKSISDCILESTFVWRGQRCRLISAYIPESHEATSEFKQLLAHLVSVQDDTVFTTVMGNMNAEIGRQDQEKLDDDSRVGRMLTHRRSNENGQHLLGLLSTIRYRLMTSLSSSKSVLTTSRRGDGSKAQIGHVICSANIGLAVNLTATWIEEIRTEHKMLRLYVEAQGSRAVSPLPSPSALTKRAYPLSAYGHLIVGSLNMNGLCVAEENVEEFETIFQREPAPSDPFQLLCLQNTGLPVGDIQTRSFKWHTSFGGTTIAVSKKLCAELIDDIKFFEVTDHILVCELLIFGKLLRLVSFYAPNGSTAKSEFAALISCLNELKNQSGSTVLMGDFKAMVGRNDQYGQPDYDLDGYENLPHDTSNENGILLKGLIRLTDYRLESARSLSRTLQSTCETLDDRLVQVDHVLASPHGDFVTQVVMAKWLREIATNHKILITHIVLQSAAGEGAKRVRV